MSFGYSSKLFGGTGSGGVSASGTGLTAGRVVLAAGPDSLTDAIPLTFDDTTDTLEVEYGTVAAANVTATALATPGAITVTPVLSQIGAITCVAGSALADGDALSVGDGVGVVPIEFDAAPGDGVTGGAVAIVFDGTETATQIRDAVKAVLDAAAVGGRDWTTSAQGADGIGLVRATPGATGGAITEDVTDAGFSVTDWTDPTHATTVTYQLVACLADGTCTQAGADSSTALATATLSATNYLSLSWSAVTGAASYKVYRKVAPTTPATTGIIYTGTALTVDDTGLAGDTTTAPTTNGTGVVTGGRVLVGDGTAAAPALARSANGTTGIYFSAAPSIRFSTAGSNYYAMSGGAFSLLGNTIQLTLGASSDLILSRPAAATLQLGAANSATPVAQTLKVQDATGTDVAAAATATYLGPAGTGTGAVGEFVVKTGAVQASGATAHVQTKRLGLKELHINLSLADVNIYANNAAALAAGLVAGDLYRTGADPDVICIVH